jgi:hypothetical protein
MAKKLSIAMLVLGSLILSACASGMVSQAAPNKEPPQCPINEQWVCTGRSATRIKTQGSDIEFCRCERADRIR